MRFNIQQPIIPMLLLIRIKPLLIMKLLSFLHIPKDLITTPPWLIPIIVILLSTSDTQSTVYTTRATEELSSTDFDLTVVSSRTLFCGDVPVCFSVEILRPEVVESVVGM